MFKKILAAIVGIAAVTFLGYSHRDLVLVKFTCADKLAQQYTTTSVINGAYDCVTPTTKAALSFFYGVNNAKDFATALGDNRIQETYLGETADGGYTYRLDGTLTPHNSVGAAFNDLKSGNFGAIWPELNGDTQGWKSIVITFYLNPPGSSESWGGKTYDTSGELLTIK